jgi:hypothetical protein
MFAKIIALTLVCILRWNYINYLFPNIALEPSLKKLTTGQETHRRLIIKDTKKLSWNIRSNEGLNLPTLEH